MSLTVISVDNSDALEGGKGVDLPLIIIVYNSITKKPQKIHAIFRFGL